MANSTVETREMSAIREFIAARDALEIAPTHNGAVFDAALERHNTAVARLYSIAKEQRHD